MSMKKNLTLLLPDSLQDALMARIIRSNRWKTVPTFNMLFSSYVMMGADREDLLEVFSAADDMGENLYRQARRKAEDRMSRGRNKAVEGDRAAARDEYQKAVMLYFIADWVTYEEERVAENYRDLLAASKRVDENAEISTEKIFFDWPIGHVAARLRMPNTGRHAESEGGWPVVMIHQGNDTVKEALLPVEDALLDEGFAVLNVDPAGWGESRLSGNGFRSIVDAPMLARRVDAYLEERPELDAGRLAVYGFSGGGTWSAMYASVSQKVSCMVNVGGGILNLYELIKGMPAMQKRQIMKHWRCSEEEIPKIAATVNFDLILPHVHADCLLVHGSEDSLVPVAYIRRAARKIAGAVELVIVPGGNHMCSDTLKTEQLPLIARWLRTHLKVDHTSQSRPDEQPELLPEAGRKAAAH